MFGSQGMLQWSLSLSTTMKKMGCLDFMLNMCSDYDQNLSYCCKCIGGLKPYHSSCHTWHHSFSFQLPILGWNRKSFVIFYCFDLCLCLSNPPWIESFLKLVVLTNYTIWSSYNLTRLHHAQVELYQWCMFYLYY